MQRHVKTSSDGSQLIIKKQTSNYIYRFWFGLDLKKSNILFVFLLSRSLGLLVDSFTEKNVKGNN